MYHRQIEIESWILIEKNPSKMHQWRERNSHCAGKVLSYLLQYFQQSTRKEIKWQLLSLRLQQREVLAHLREILRIGKKGLEPVVPLQKEVGKFMFLEINLYRLKEDVHKETTENCFKEKGETDKTSLPHTMIQILMRNPRNNPASF